MKLTIESKTLIEAINTVLATTGSETLNLEIGKNDVIHLKSNAKGCSHHLVTGFVAEQAEKGFRVALNAPQLVGLINRKGEVTLEVESENILQISNKRFKAQVNLVPAVSIDKIEAADSVVILENGTLTAMWDRLNGLQVTNLYQDSSPFIRVRCKDGLLEMGSNDSVHFAYYRIEVDSEQEPFEFDLDQQLMRRLLGIIVDNPDAKFAIEDTRVYVKSNDQAISFPKQQGGKRLATLDMLYTLAQSLANTGGSALNNISREELVGELSGCRFIASDKAALEISGGAKGKGLILSYQTSFGSYKAKVDCTSEWDKDEVYKVDPFLFEDFLGTLSLYDQLNLHHHEGKLFANVKGDGYESFHICSGN